ncbi:hypothetical protein SASPL_154190 [Salvia splendens]|uniref:Uncharacterized protein n=1 Tax=Salvia splendens TaxID=180675 RepID=A0A8X8VZL3_SALSN|nr:hypothetical protein SASPL_154190 [Salvia splendens]
MGSKPRIPTSTAAGRLKRRLSNSSWRLRKRQLCPRNSANSDSAVSGKLAALKSLIPSGFGDAKPDQLFRETADHISSFLYSYMHAFVFGRIPIVKHYRKKAASEGSKTVASDLAAAGIHTADDQVVCSCAHGTLQLLGSRRKVRDCLRLKSRKGLVFVAFGAHSVLLLHGDQGWMIMLVSFLGLTNGYLTVCARLRHQSRI